MNNFTNATTPAYDLPIDLVSAIQNIYEPAGINVTTSPSRELESAEYEACRFSLNDCNVVFRKAKTTPTKIGQFLTTWKRLNPNGPIVPLDFNDNIDFLVVSVNDKTNQGQFIFDKKLLLAKGIISHRG